MPVGDGRKSSAVLLARRLRWNRATNEDPRPQPAVVLLGPVGSGKSYTLRAISDDCGRSIVHALLDFERDKPAGTAQALVQIADRMNRKWPARRAIRFTRFTLCLIAALTKLEHASPAEDEAVLRAVVEGFLRNPEAERSVAEVPLLSATAPPPDEAGQALAATLRTALPGLLRAVDRRPLKDSRQWHEDIPQAERGHTPLQTLVALNEQVTSDPSLTGSWLAAAFLADVRENQPRMAAPDPGSPCVCDDRDSRPHFHNWILLLDNIDHGIGDQFLRDLRVARDRHLARSPQDYDALLVIAASGRWNDDWGADWRPVWVPEPDTPDRARTVVRCRDASYWHWRGGTETQPEPAPPRNYPVLLEPLGADETARVLGGISELSEQCVFAQRATGGLPAAVDTLKPLLRDRELAPGARDVLARPEDAAAAGAEDVWLARLGELRLTRHLPDVDVRDFVTAAAYATAPWLTPADAKGVLPQPHVGRILTELRRALWVIAPGGGRGTSDHTELHPWVARTLTSALAARPEDENGYTEQFEALLADLEPARAAPPEGDDAGAYTGEFQALASVPASRADQARQLYCKLALGWFTDVVDSFRKAFDAEPHQDWIDRLELVTSAPDNLPQRKDRATLYSELIDERNRSQPEERSAVGNIVSRLVAAMWLAANPFAVPDAEQQNVIVNAYRELAPLSRRPDVGALYSAARRADESRL